MENVKKYLAEFIGTFMLVFLGCGSAVLWNADGMLTACAFGLALVICAYLFGHISGAHVNPAVSLGFLLEKRIKPALFVGYLLSQCAGAICAACLLKVLVAFPLGIGVGENHLYINSFSASICVEAILTFIFVLVVLSVSAREELSRISGLIIGGALTLVHIVGIPLTGTSVNPARSLVVLFSGKPYLVDTLPVFILGPFIGAIAAAGVHLFFVKNFEENTVEAVSETTASEEPEQVEETETETVSEEEIAAPVCEPEDGADIMAQEEEPEIWTADDPSEIVDED